MVCDFTKLENHIIEYLDHPQWGIRNLLPRKLDPPDTFNEVAAAALALTGGTERCDTQQSIERYVRTHIFCVLGTIVFSDKSTTSLNSKFLPLLRDFDRISSYSWGEACLAHLYRSLCRTSRYRCKEMDAVEIPDVVAAQLFMCSTQSPLVSFECIEWHPTDRVRRQFGMQQLPPSPTFDLGRDHCTGFRGA
ncbi:hypothetical protein Ahy_A09g045611 isoform A [Arachis hypogaea]|uniref:Aminotransferase-like plant mobile domain-containing protein n=1 Tax=Arachis hypogaea TaxID=3818 RepID=A0A445BMS2_ARAHY|nr:hypothetical protein Ahy_A09g045611 isoform A [Arachis hypogaea]